MNNSILRPGINPATLAKCGIDYDNYPFNNSIRIPYFTIDGTPIYYTDSKGKQAEFARWRLPKSHETPDKKYHQPAGSPIHAYHPPTGMRPAKELFIPEGEFKFISLYEDGHEGLALPNFTHTRVLGQIINASFCLKLRQRLNGFSQACCSLLETRILVQIFN